MNLGSLNLESMTVTAGAVRSAPHNNEDKEKRLANEFKQKKEGVRKEMHTVRYTGRLQYSCASSWRRRPGSELRGLESFNDSK